MPQHAQVEQRPWKRRAMLCKKPVCSAFADRLVADYERRRAADSGTGA